MLRVLLIVPYPELETRVMDIWENHFRSNGLDVDVISATAEELTKTIHLDAYDIIIGRGHTAQLLKQINGAYSVVDIPITGYDVLRAIEEARRCHAGKRIALFLSAVRNHDAQVLSDVSGLDIRIFVVQDISEMEATMAYIKEEGYDVVVGGYSARISAERMGLPAVVIQTGDEAIMQAFAEAQNMVSSVNKERERAKLYQTVTQASKEGIMYVDVSGMVELVNKRGLQTISSPLNSICGSHISQAYPCLYPLYERTVSWKIPILNELIEIDGKKMTFDFVPVMMGSRITGVVITFQSVSKIQQMETQIRKRLSEKGLVAKYTFNDIIYESRIMEQTISLAKKYAAVSSNILIVGETGTGKELLAQGIHNMSERNKKPFVAVNCAALPENLLESELFGYVEGAFTGSKKGGKVGLVELAHQGTLFLDEISELPYTFQGELLRVLQERQVRRIGDERIIDVDVRIIAATNRNLKKLVEDGSFRRDLLYRLDILKIYLPPLCDRGDDIVLIFQHLLKKYSSRFGKDVGGCTEGARQRLREHPFEGNVRELSNLAERLCVMVEGNVIDEDLMLRALYPEDVRERERKAAEATKNRDRQKSEAEEITEALRLSGGKKADAARMLNMDRTTLWRKIKQYGLND